MNLFDPFALSLSKGLLRKIGSDNLRANGTSRHERAGAIAYRSKVIDHFLLMRMVIV